MDMFQLKAGRYLLYLDILGFKHIAQTRTHIHKDRFCEGHLAAMFENGHVVTLLRRLKAIRDDTNSGILRRNNDGK